MPWASTSPDSLVCSRMPSAGTPARDSFFARSSGSRASNSARGRIAGYKIPKRVEFRDELARTATGKIQKFKLRESFWKDSDRQIN